MGYQAIHSGPVVSSEYGPGSTHWTLGHVSHKAAPTGALPRSQSLRRGTRKTMGGTWRVSLNGAHPWCRRSRLGEVAVARVGTTMTCT